MKQYSAVVHGTADLHVYVRMGLKSALVFLGTARWLPNSDSVNSGFIHTIYAQ